MLNKKEDQMYKDDKGHGSHGSQSHPMDHDGRSENGKNKK